MNKEKKDLKKIIIPVALTGLAIVGAAVGSVCLYELRIKKAKCDLLKYITDYVPFKDMSKDAAIDLMKHAIEGGVEILDAQGPMPDTSEILIFLRK